MVVSVHTDRKAGECQSERIVPAMHDGCLSMTDRGRLLLFMQSGAQEKAMMAHRSICVRQRVSGIERDCAFQKHQRPCDLRRHPRIDVGLSLQDKVIGIKAIGPLAFDALDFGPTQARLYRADHVQGDLVLKRENIVERAVKSLGPQMASSLRLYHLSGDTDTTAILTYASLE